MRLRISNNSCSRIFVKSLPKAKTFPESGRTRPSAAFSKTVFPLPAGWETDAKRLAHKDVAARWTKQNQQTDYGCKDHVVADWESKLIVRAEVTAANAPDSQA